MSTGLRQSTAALSNPLDSLNYSVLKNSFKLGQWGENRAEEFLINQGYRILERNYRIPGGEIDIIAEEKDEIVFVEVKTYA